MSEKIVDISILISTAEEGDAGAQFNLGYMYHMGEIVPQDHVEAIKWYRKAAEQGHARSQLNLGNIYDDGEGVLQDHVEAVKWYRMSAEKGNIDARFNLGMMYLVGGGVPRDYVEAAKWLRMAAKQGDDDAQYVLGNTFGKGESVLQDPVEEVNWYRLAAEQGDGYAQFNLGVMYGKGEGVPKSDTEAVRWYRRAAEQGYSIAQYKLATMYANLETGQAEDTITEWNNEQTPFPGGSVYIKWPESMPPETNSDEIDFDEQDDLRKRPYSDFQKDELIELFNNDYVEFEIVIEIVFELMFRKDMPEEFKSEVIECLINFYEGLEKIVPPPPDYPFPSTDVFETRKKIRYQLGNPDWREIGLLKVSGYTVGMNRVNTEQRIRILNHIFLVDDLSDVDDEEYASEWGDPKTSERLYKLSHTISAFVRNAKRQSKNMREAIDDWEADLEYLKETFYEGWGDFPWPNADI